MLSIEKVVMVFVLLSASVWVRADFTSAMANYNAKKFPEAMEEFKRLASLGNKESQFNMGVMYFRGEGVDQNPVEAYGWMAVAAADGIPERVRLRDLVMKKMNKAQKQQALTRTEELLNQYGDQMLKDKLTPVLLSDVDCEFHLNPIKYATPDYPSAMRNSGVTGSVDLDFTIDKLGFVRDYSVIIATNKEFEKSSLDAIKKWRYEPVVVGGKAIDVSVKQIRINFRIHGGSMDKKLIKEYVTKLRDKASNGTPKDMYVFAYITGMISELGVERQEANSWLLKAAQAGLPSAQYEMGKALVRGEGCKKDVQKGVQWLALAAQDSSADAQYYLGVSLLGSDSFQQNKKQAIEWLNHAAVSNHAKAMMRLAWILATDKEEIYRNNVKSLELVNKVHEFYPDQFRANETLAAAQATNGLFDEAVKSQQLAIKFAKKVGYPLTDMEQRLTAYQQNQPWRE